MPPKEKGKNKPKEHEEQKQTDSRHGDQHRPPLLFVENKPLKSFGQQQDPLHNQQDDEQSPRCNLKPAELGFDIAVWSAGVSIAPFFPILSN